ncbi:S9 family peptidase [Aliifodinibius salipaludis]|uniref:S9 family peptidase n=1 Tax=Fodinibius salipaludis TaxID=2032627 RepID=A0A2A2GDE8_9BACT|nr:alpha/beta fold hydrolase [Aliifodinibius salipaludis]PAU94875.1 S9 family peptidase [Aliifodinibius salipaludis]
MRSFLKIFFVLLFIPALGYGQSGLDTLSLESIFYDPLLSGNRPDIVSFSPDQSHIYYQANDSSMTEEELFQRPVTGGERKLVADKVERNFSVSPNRQKLLYTDQGDIWIADLDFTNKKQLIDSKAEEYGAKWGPDSERIAFVQDGDIWMININTSKLTQVTSKKEDEPGFSVEGWAGNDKLILTQYDTSDYEEYYFPEYVGQRVEPGSTRRGIARQLVSIADLQNKEIDLLLENKGYIDTDISAEGNYLAVDVTGAPMKKREVKVFDLSSKNPTTVFEDSTKGWLYNTEIAFAPSGDRLMVLSEKDGWNHIYTVNPDGSNLQQHTDGEYEVPWAEWLNSNAIIYASTEVGPGERHIYRMNINKNETDKLTKEAGYRQNFELSKDKDQLVYRYSYFNEPFEIYSLDLSDQSAEKRLTETIPDQFNKIDWQKEDYIRFAARDGETKLSMSVLEPIDKKEKSGNPVVVFVHGAGSLQNVYKGWSNNYYREYMFHQYLTARGYYVIEVDYRHSTGYGREFREDVTNWMGKYETRDIIDGVDYLAEHYPQADTSRVGIYGGSYGGFMALYATSVAPGYFDAAAALRAVTNWENYYQTNPWYTQPRLGTPEADSAHYARSSPITYVEQLEDPVLILHGLTDNNVGFQDAAQYIEKLIQTGDKEFDMMMYPSERHSFEDPDAWFDEYSRIFDFFNKHLKNETD